MRAHATADQLLERYGVVTRGSVVNEGIPGGFALMYKVLNGFEDSGRCRRGYFVNSLGGAQFSTSDVVDRLREHGNAYDETRASRTVVALAATDPANPYGAALPWPKSAGHRPGRKAGALVVLTDGDLALYVERGGKTVLTYTGSDDDACAMAAGALAELVKQRHVDKLLIEVVDGQPIHGTSFAAVLAGAGFAPTPRGLRLRRV